MKKGVTLVISAPAGTGKTTLVRMLMNEFPSVVESISFTTRAPRPSEVEGEHYHFISKEEFQKKIKNGEFLEYAEVFGNFYGTSKKLLEDQLAKGKHVALVIDTQGARQLKKKLDAVFIFISPPSLKELKRRLHTRSSDSEEAIEKRLSWAEKEMKCIPEYDYHIVNDDLQTAYETLRSILIAEEGKKR